MPRPDPGPGRRPAVPDSVAGPDLRAWSAHSGTPVEAAAVRRALMAGSLPSAAARTARRRPQAEAVRVGDRGITFGQLADQALRLANYLAGHGAGRGGRVLLAGANSVAYVVAYLGILTAGGTVVLAGPMLTERELGILVEDCDPVLALASAARVGQLTDLLPARVLDLDGDGPRGLADAVARSRPAPLPAVGPSAIAHLAFTSGTTGRPKATPLTHANVLASARSVMTAWRWSAGDVLVHALPMQHGHGLSGLHVALLSGSRTVALPRFDPRELVRVVGEQRATALFAVPTMYQRMLDAGVLGAASVRGLRLATSGSAALAPSTSDLVLEQAGWRPLERYGLTETGFVTSNLLGDRRAGTVGLPLPGAELRIADASGSPRPAGQAGEIQLRGAQVFAGYAGQGSASFTADGWFRSGDVGSVSPESGHLTISGRSKELIVTGGFNVYPREVEIVLSRLPQIKEVAVVGLPSARWGEQVTAFVVVADGARFDPAAVTEFAARELAAYKRPKEYRLVDSLPRNHLGKLLRDRLTAGGQPQPGR